MKPLATASLLQHHARSPPVFTPPPLLCQPQKSRTRQVDFLRLAEEEWSLAPSAEGPSSQRALRDVAYACRYHYNVSADRMLSHVKKGWDQGLRISSATSNSILWALVMDEATGYSKQSYRVSDAFLPKSWCMAQWDAGMYITAVAGVQPSAAFQCSA